MFTLNCKGRLLIIDKPIIMGIINTTPDSFYSNSRKQSVDEALRHAEKMLNEGATIIDIGGQSTRPGSDQVGVEEELNRIIPVIETINKHLPEAFISIDTYYSKVAEETIAAGASIINDISGGTIDEKILSIIATNHVPYVCMHMKGKQQTMQQNPQYKDVTKEVLDFFIKRIGDCQKAEINDVIVDIGFGFGKTIEHNFTLLKNLSVFKMLGTPLLLGISRKSSISKTLNISTGEALNGSTILHTIGLLNGANILRVHDVKEAMECVKLLDTYNKV